MILKKILFGRLARVIATIIFVLVAAFFVFQKKARSMEESRVALVDVIGNNYVFRGSNPFEHQEDGNVFSYKKLTSELNKSLIKNGHTRLDDYYLIDISLLDNDQYFVLKQEEEFFKNNPSLGAFQHLSTISQGLLLTRFDSSFSRTFTDDYNAYVTAALKNIHDLAAAKTDKKTVVFVHCDAGRDRTGFITASYRMLYKDMTLKETIAQNIRDAGRTSNGFYASAIKSYCRYLNTSNGQYGAKTDAVISDNYLDTPLKCEESRSLPAGVQLAESPNK